MTQLNSMLQLELGKYKQYMASEHEFTLHKLMNFNTTQLPPRSTDHNSPQNHSVQSK